MDKFTLIYQILRFIEMAADKDEFDVDRFTAAHFKVERNEFLNAIEMLIDAGYIKGVELREAVDWRIDMFITWPKLTLDGLKFYATDDLMLKEAKNAKGASWNPKNLI